MFNLSILALNFIFLYTLYANTIIYNNPRNEKTKETRTARIKNTYKKKAYRKEEENE